MKSQVRDKNRHHTILDVDDLCISYETRRGDVPAVRGVSFKAHRGETIGLVGESGCGKSTIAFGIVDFLGPNGKIVGGSIKFQGKNLVGRSEEELRQLRGNQIAMVYQDPMQALNPSLRVGEQLAETLTFHQQIGRDEAWDRSIEMLKRVHMPDPSNVMVRYPHQISGGQQQRVVIAMALLNNPVLLVMDEPTTALDVTVEAAVLDLIEDLKQDFDTGILYITHNLGVVARVSDTLSVMYAGELVEQGTTREVFSDPLHPYTQGLMRCVPKLGSSKASAILYPIRGRVPPPAERPDNACIYSPRCDYATDKCRSERPELRQIKKGHCARCIYAEEIDRHAWAPTADVLSKLHSSEPAEAYRDYVLKVENLKTYYQQESKSVLDLLGLAREKYVKAVDDVTFEVPKRRTLGIVGESGCGKTTLVKAIIGLEKMDDGKAEFLGLDIDVPLEERNIKLIKEMQMVFQNPDSTLNPSYPVGKQISRPLKRFKIVPKNQIRDRVISLLRAVRLDGYYYERLPRQLSGGEKQRVGIARALASRPDLVICDEPVSALDVSVQASVLNLLMDLQEEFGTTIIFIAHDLSVVRFLSDYVAVMYLGQIMEIGPAEAIYAPPYHPYTEALLSAVPIPDPTVEQKHIRLSGPVPSALNPPPGCPFHTRCPRRSLLAGNGEICEAEVPPWRRPETAHRIFCHIPLEELEKFEPV
ncbi:MAG: dipeptide ABC transporter ATP-binding protein, partial [Proteobacteria bacterium]|nr:dipeptide ABC transporter ATP-binding protein [Pseudomonadota bacterium]